MTTPVVPGQCACGSVRFEIDFPAFWAWHDHSPATRVAHGAAYATYVGVWRSRYRVLAGEPEIGRYEDKGTGRARSFCGRCGTPLLYERSPMARMVNIPRALFARRTGREPRYHVGIDEMAEWSYRGERLRPLKGYPGVVWTGGGRARAAEEWAAVTDDAP